MSDVETHSEFNPMTEWNVDWTSTILPELLHKSPIHVIFLDPDTGAQISTVTMVSLHIDIDGVHFEVDWQGARWQATIVILHSQRIAAFKRLSQGLCGETTVEIFASQTMSIETWELASDGAEG